MNWHSETQVLVCPFKAPETSEGGIIVPDSYRIEHFAGEVIASSPDMDLGIEPGDVIVYYIDQQFYVEQGRFEPLAVTSDRSYFRVSKGRIMAKVPRHIAPKAKKNPTDFFREAVRSGYGPSHAKPLGTRVFVALESDTEDETFDPQTGMMRRASGILTSQKQKLASTNVIGTLLNMGPDVNSSFRSSRDHLSEGDKIMLSRYPAGSSLPGRDYIYHMDVSDVVAVERPDGWHPVGPWAMLLPCSLDYKRVRYSPDSEKPEFMDYGWQKRKAEEGSMDALIIPDTANQNNILSDFSIVWRHGGGVNAKSAIWREVSHLGGCLSHEDGSPLKEMYDAVLHQMPRDPDGTWISGWAMPMKFRGLPMFVLHMRAFIGIMRGSNPLVEMCRQDYEGF